MAFGQTAPRSEVAQELSAGVLSAYLPERFWEKVNKNGPIHPKLGTRCWLWLGSLDTSGYGLFRLNGKLWKAHRLMWVTYVGELKSCGLHKCDVCNCCRLEHLFDGTRLDNNADRDAKGRQIAHPGSTHGRALFMENDVLEIRSRYELGDTDLHKLAEQYGASYYCIYDIVKRRSWRHI